MGASRLNVRRHSGASRAALSAAVVTVSLSGLASSPDMGNLLAGAGWPLNNLTISYGVFGGGSFVVATSSSRRIQSRPRSR